MKRNEVLLLTVLSHVSDEYSKACIPFYISFFSPIHLIYHVHLHLIVSHHLTAVSDHLNAPLLWDTEVLSRFQWSLCHVPTFQSYEFKVTTLTHTLCLLLLNTFIPYLMCMTTCHVPTYHSDIFPCLDLCFCR